MSSPVNVLYVMGSGHSGSTLLDMVVGQIPGFFSCGEAHILFRLRHDHLCVCGEPLTSCGVWSAVVGARRAVDTLASPELTRGQDYQRAVRARNMPMLLARPQRLPLAGNAARYATLITNVYRTLLTVTGARVLVDSSKERSYAALLGLLPEVNARFVHLVRDPRGVAYSYLRAQRRRMTGGDSSYRLSVHRVARQGAQWVVANTLAELVSARHRNRSSERVRYEDLISKGDMIVRNLAQLFSTDAASYDVIRDGHAFLGPNHMLTGNASRSRTGKVALKAERSGSPRSRPPTLRSSARSPFRC